MPRKRLSMRKIRDVLRLKYGLGRSHREIAAILRISHSTVGSYVRRAREAGVSWPLPDELDDARLEAALYPPTPPSRVRRPEPDWGRVHRELSRHKGMTLQLLWLEYREAHPDGYQYSRFCDRYREWRGRIDVVLRQVYRAGEKAFVDYAGPTVEVTDRRTGEIHEAKVFVGVLAASNHTFVDLTRTRSLPDWTASHVRMFEFWGGVPELVIPDNEKAAVRQASRYEPDVNRTYHDLVVHYGTAVLPARPRSPQDKAKVEAAVQNVVDRPALKPLPADRYEYAEWRKARVNIDYHIQVDGRFYSVPHALARREVEVRLGTTTIEIFHKHRRVAAHVRGRSKGGYTTVPAHMSAAHRAHLEWTPSRLVRWARKTGPETAAFARKLLETRRHPEQGYRSCLGLMRLARAYPAERMEAACRRALDIGAHSYKSVKTILSAGLDQADDGDQRSLSLPADHAHVRGPDYYANSHNGKES